MRWIRRASILVPAAFALVLPGPASAVSLAPPGKAGANQYFETVPTAAGDAAPPQGGNGFSGPGSRGLSDLGHGRAGAAGLDRLGKSGHAAAALAAATAPSPVHLATEGKPNGRGASSGQLQSRNEPSAQSTVSALADLLNGSDVGGLGFVLPLLLVTAFGAALAAGIAALRSRRGGPPDAVA